MFLSKSSLISVRRSVHSASNDSLKYCLESVRRYDRENLTSTLLLKENAIGPAIAVRAFNVEVSRVRDQASEDAIALMRFRFWSDALRSLYSGSVQDNTNVTAHPVVRLLKSVLSSHQISKRNLDRLIACREKNLTKKYYSSLDEMEKYAEESVSPIYYSILEIHKVKNVHADHAASHLGKAQGLTNMLRSLQLMAKNKIVLLPQDILMKHNLSQETVLRCEVNQNFKDAIFDVATRANQHLEKARSISVPPESKRIFLPAVAIDSYLKRLQKKDFSIFDKSLTGTNSMLPLALLWNKLLSKY